LEKEKYMSTHKRVHTGAQNGFTLIELLIVIAIIAILAAILFPVFARARENARRASCQSNLKQIGLGVMQYTQDYDEKYPLTETSVGGVGNVRWRQMIQSYIKSSQVFACPSNTRNSVNFDNAAGNYPAIPVSYAANEHIMAEQDGRSMSSISSPSTRIMVVETIDDPTFGVWTPAVGYIGSPWAGNGNFLKAGNVPMLFAGHMGTSNYLFADGHVKALRPTKTMSPMNMWGRFDPQGDSDGAGCGAGSGFLPYRNPDCETPVASVLSALQVVESYYQ
jgi:prepilin-type N-terminal cleavage/methylation domain-containing protein/prepilin-type processing-associated H-X9-DG protein